MSEFHGVAGPAELVDAGALDARNLTLDLADQARARPHATALELAGRVLTYGELEGMVSRSAWWLHRQGVEAGEIVAVHLQDPVSLACAMLGLMQLGATPVVLAPSTTTSQVTDLLRESGASRMLVAAQQSVPQACTSLVFSESLLHDAQVTPQTSCMAFQPSAPCLLIIGSGTTGSPRLMPVTHGQMRARCHIVRQTWGFNAQDRVMVVAPLHFATPTFLILAVLAAGATGIVWGQRGELGIALRDARPDVVHLSVFHAEKILQEQAQKPSLDYSAIRVLSIGASTVSEDLRQRLRSHLNAKLHLHYGTNEAFPLCFAYPSDLGVAPGVVGRPAPGVTLEIVDASDRSLDPGEIGHVRVRSPALISGYLGGADSDRFRDGWFYPGDLARWTPDGQLVHCGRADQMMIMNGINIYPAEIERVLDGHPAVREVIAFPLAHPVAQDLPVCVVVLHEGTTASRDELLTHARTRLGAKAPRAVVVLETIARNEQGKPVRAELTRQVLAALEGADRSAPSPASPAGGRLEVAPGYVDTRQRRQRLVLTCAVPPAPRLLELDAWCALLAGTWPVADRQGDPGRGESLAYASQAQVAESWLSAVLRMAAEILLAARIPAFEPPRLLGCQAVGESPEAAAATWRALVELPTLEQLAPRLLEAALDAALRTARWVHEHPEHEVAHAASREAFFVWLEPRVLAPLRRLSPPGKSTLPVLQAAHARGIPFLHLGQGVFQLGWGSAARRIDRSTTQFDSAMGSKLAQNKAAAARLLRAAGLPAPRHEVVASLKDARAAGERLGWPVVLKPVDRERGEGVTVDVQAVGLEAAFDLALRLSASRQVIVERQVAGVCHRIFVAGQALLYAVKRLPMGVYGDGVQTVSALVAGALAKQEALPPWRRSGMRPMDELALQALAAAGYTPSSVPAAGQFVPLRRIESTAWGGIDEEVTREVHPENLRVALVATQQFGLDVAGIDIISPDISQPWYSNGAIINEVNFAPLLGGGEISRSHIPQYLQRLLGGDGRIPVEVFVGDAQALRQAQQRHGEWASRGLRAWLTSHAQTLGPDGKPQPLAARGLRGRIRALLLDAQVDALVLVVQTDEPVDTGLPLEGVDSVHVVNRYVSSLRPEQAAERLTRLLQDLADWTWPRNIALTTGSSSQIAQPPRGRLAHA